METNLEKLDRRVKRTQNLLAKALIELTLEKGYDAITIRDITYRADVGYATFFRHYPDKDALLEDVLEVVLDELMDLFMRFSTDDDPTTEGLLLFSYVQEHVEVVRVLLSSHGSSSLMKRIIEAGTQSALENQEQNPDSAADSVVPVEIAAYHLVAASISLVQWWLEHDMPYSPERMGSIYYELIVRPTRSIGLPGKTGESGKTARE